MVDLIEVEDFFVVRLTPIVSPLPVKPFPNISGIQEFKDNINSALGAVTIAIRRLQNAQAGEHGSEFAYYPQFTIFSSNLRSDTTGHHGAYDVVRLISNNVHEKKFIIDDELFTCYVDSAYYVGRDDDLFAYAVDTILIPKLARL